MLSPISLDNSAVPDVFISHASEDQEAVALPLTRLLQTAGLQVWYDEMELKAGDNLREKVEEGLSRSRFGVVILSKHFLEKDWTRNELDALWSREVGGSKVLIPVWHLITREQVAKYSILMANRLAVTTDKGLERVVEEILRVVKGPSSGVFQHPARSGETTKGEVAGSSPKPDDAVSSIQNRLDIALEGHYIIESLIASGEVAIVYRARDRYLNRQVAIKVLNTFQLAPNVQGEAIAKFHNEMRHAGSLKHRNIVQVYSAIQSPDLPFIVLEFVEGVRLDKIIETTGVQPFRKVRDFIWHLAGALGYAHRKGYIHLSLRPTGVLIDYEGQPMISPFKLLRESEIKDNEEWNLCAEELKYQSPEQYGFDESFTRTSGLSDQYMLGLIAYEMIVGKPVISGTKFSEIRRQKEKFMSAPPDLRSVRADCPEQLSAVVMKMLSTRPEDRWSHMEDTRHAVEGINLAGKLGKFPARQQAMHKAMESYNRCRESVGFVEEFYRMFFAVYPEVRGRFPTDLAKQYYLLRESLDLILQFPTDALAEPTTLTRVAESHRQRKIGTAFYDSFTSILIETVQRHDPWCGVDLVRQEIVDAWKVTILPAIQYMKSRA